MTGSTKQRGGAVVDSASGAGRIRDLQQAVSASLGSVRGLLTSIPLEDLIIGTDLFLAVADPLDRAFALSALAAQARDVANGTLTLALYRVDESELLPTRFTARLSGSAVINLDGTTREYCGILPVPKEIDRTAAAWLAGVMGSTGTVIVRGSESYTAPAFAGWRIAAAGALPATILSAALTFSAAVPSVALLTQAGTRLRGTGTITP